MHLLQESVYKALDSYLTKLNGQEPNDLYNLLLTEVELPLLKSVMQYVRYNQCRAADFLGISRGTLRKKLKLYDMLK